MVLVVVTDIPADIVHGTVVAARLLTIVEEDVMFRYEVAGHWV